MQQFIIIGKDWLIRQIEDSSFEFEYVIFADNKENACDKFIEIFPGCEIVKIEG